MVRQAAKTSEALRLAPLNGRLRATVGASRVRISGRRSGQNAVRPGARRRPLYRLLVNEERSGVCCSSGATPCHARAIRMRDRGDDQIAFKPHLRRPLGGGIS